MIELCNIYKNIMKKIYLLIFHTNLVIMAFLSLMVQMDQRNCFIKDNVKYYQARQRNYNKSK